MEIQLSEVLRENQELKERVKELETALTKAEQRLTELWKAETQSFATQNRDLGERPDLCTGVDKYGFETFPTACALAQARTILAKGKTS